MSNITPEERAEAQAGLLDEHKANSYAFVLIGALAYHLTTGKTLPDTGSTPILLRSLLTDPEVAQTFTRLIVTLPASALATVGGLLLQSWRQGGVMPEGLEMALETLKKQVSSDKLEVMLTMAETPQTPVGTKVRTPFSFGSNGNSSVN